MKKSNVYIVAGLLLIIVLMTSVSAHKWACLSYGDTVPHYTCHFTHCKLCLDDDGYSTSFGFCEKIKNCVFGPANNDTTPPVLTVNSPIDGQIFKTNKILFNLTIDEPSTIYYKNNQDIGGKFKTLAGNRLFYKNQLSFRDGFYNITIRAEDRSGNDADILRSFYVDTKTPKPDSPKFEDSNFSFKFSEANPVTVSMKYGNNVTGYNTMDIALSNCNKTNDKYTCKISLTKSQFNSIINVYDGQSIECSIIVDDVAGNIAESKKTKLNIDITLPIINNPQTIFNVNGRYVLFNISINEQNLDKVYYALNSTNPKWQNLCSLVKNGLCSKKVSFPKGNYDVLVKVADKAGNFITKEIQFTIN